MLANSVAQVSKPALSPEQPVAGRGSRRAASSLCCRGLNTNLFRFWLAISSLFFLSQESFAQYTLEYSTNGNVITVTNYTGTPVNVAIPNFVTAIGGDAFFGCQSLTNVTMGSNVTSIGPNSFYDCTNLAGVTIGNGVTNIGGSAFSMCYSLNSVALGNSVSSIGGQAFGWCLSLADVTLPDGVTNLGDYAFAECYGLTNIIIDNGITSIGEGTFQFCGRLTSVTLPNGVASIGDGAFDSSGLTNVVIPDSVTNIEADAFDDSSGLKSVTIGNSVSSLGEQAFGWCLSLASIYFEGNSPGADSTVFTNSYSLTGLDPATAYYLYGTKDWVVFSADTGIPAVLLNPPIATSTGGFGIQNNQFGFTIAGPTNTTIVVQASTNLSTWIAVQTNTLANGSIYFSDAAWTNYPGRFYRVLYPLP
jgi:hypothetical protein